jgi:predicted MFS family arabinose efflux permease
VADLTRAEQRTKAMALVGISIGLSFALARVLGPVLATFGGLAAVFWFTALLAAVGIAVVLFLVPTPPPAGAHYDVGARRGYIGRSLRDKNLVRLNFGVFVLHFILMACFLMVPVLIEQSLEIPRDRHWAVYLPVLLLSLAGMVPLMMLGERGGRPRQAFLLGIALIVTAIVTLAVSVVSPLFYVGLWLFFVGFNYLEATLPSLVSKTVFAEGKGTAMGIYSTCQFLGAFAGGALGGLLLHYFGEAALTAVCLVLAIAWWLLVLQAAEVEVDDSLTSQRLTDS